MNVDGGPVGSASGATGMPPVTSVTNLDAYSYQPEKSVLPPHTSASRYEYPQSHSTFARPWQSNDWVKPTVESSRSPSYNTQQDVPSAYFNGNGTNFSGSVPQSRDGPDL